MKKLLFITLFFPFFIFAQVSDNFDDGNITGWTESTAARWNASTDNPINGTYSLHHIFDTTEASHDQISYSLPSLNLGAGTTTWRFQLRHGYNPSSSNNWGVFLFADNNASEMYPGGNINGYVIGIDYSDSDDTLKLWKITSGMASELIKTNIDWEDSVGTSNAAGFEINRTSTGEWEIKIDSDGGFDNLISKGIGNDSEHTADNHFGVYFEYSATQDMKLWFDDLSINYTYVDDDSKVEAPVSQIISGFISSLDTIASDSVDVFKFKISDLGTSDGFTTDVFQIVIKNKYPVNNADWTNNIQGVKLKDEANDISLNYFTITDDNITISLDSGSIVIPNANSKEITLSLFLNSSDIEDGKVLQFFIDDDNHGWLANNTGSSFASDFGDSIISNEFIIQVEATRLLYSSVPTTVGVNQDFSLDIAATDTNGNTDIDATNELTISLYEGIGNLTTANPVVNLISGVYSWADLKYDKVENFKISVTTTGLNPANSDYISALSDDDSKAESPISQIPPGTISSLANSVDEAIDVFRFKISDLGTNDGLPTKVTRLVIKNHHPANEADWEQSINGITLSDGENISFDSVTINNDSLTIYIKTDSLIVADNSNKEVTLTIYLKEEGLTDNTNLSFMLDADSHGFIADSSGSVFAADFGTDIISNNFVIDVQATQLTYTSISSSIIADSVFNISVAAVDTNSNIDIDNTNSVTISKIFGYGEISSQAGLIQNLVNGEYLWSDFIFNNNVYFAVLSESGGLTSISSDTLIAVNQYFVDDFEAGNLDLWENINDWIVTNEDSINGNYSLKHNLDGVPDTSYILMQDTAVKLGNGITRWRFILKNGNWDPSGSNKFWFYLLANNENLICDTVDGYAVGVNLSGSSDLLSVWKVTDAHVDETIISSEFNWGKNDQIGIEILRSSVGEWELNYDTLGSFDNLVYAGTGVDNDYTFNDYGGLAFYFTTSYAGQLWMDDIEVAAINTAPKINEIITINADSIKIIFTEEVEETSATNISNYVITPYSTAPITINNAYIDEIETKIVYLSVTDLVTDNYSLTVNNITDIENLPMINETIDFMYIIPPVKGDVVITEIMADPSPIVNLPEHDYLELFNNTNYDVYLQDWTLTIGSNTRTFPEFILKPDSFLICCSSSAIEELEQYGDALVITGSTDLTVSGKTLILKDNTNLIISLLSYNKTWYKDPEKENGGWSLEIIDPENICSSYSNWIASNNENGGTPGEINSVNAPNLDETPPELSSLSVKSSNWIQLEFSEIINNISAENILNYSINNGIGNPDSAVINNESGKFIDIYFSNSFIDETSYSLTIENITDECDNVIVTVLNGFVFYIVKQHDIVINEIFADPEPIVGLPAYDYLELYNKSDFDIDLSNWTLTIGTSTKTFSSYTINSNDYLIVTSSSAVEEFQTYGNVIGLISTTALTTTGKEIILKDSADNIISTVTYNKNWYHDTEKDDGGWSIEQIDPENTCGAIYNWTASVDSSGGTPGKINSVNAENIDTIVPVIEELRIISDNSLKLRFSEFMNIETSENILNYYVDNEIGNPDSAIYDAENEGVVYLYFTNTFEDENQYSIIIKDINDYCENIIITDTIEFIYYIPKQFDVVINEIMADPEPVVGLPVYDYLELYNKSNFDIDLTDWTITIGTNTKTFPEYTLASKNYLLLCASSAVEFLQEYGEILGIISTTDLTTTGKEIILKDSADNIISTVTYNKNWYHDTEKDDGGWSIEQIDPENTCGAIYNWTASVDSSGGTPGKINSVNAENIDTIVPVIEELRIISDNSLKLRFSEFMNIETSENILNYYVDNEIGNPDSAIYDTENEGVVYLYFTNTFADENQYSIIIKDISDYCENIIITDTIEFIYYIPKQYDVVINEIMADPEPVVGLPVYDYLELYNKSDFDIDLTDWTITIGTNTKTFPEYTLASKNYLLLCASSAVEFLQEYGEILGIISTTDLTTTGKEIILKDSADNTISTVSYNKNWYHDTEKDDGGWSIEQIDPENTCGAIYNWTASIDVSGGTPGRINSVDAENIDTIAPKLININVVSPFHLKLEFSEYLPEISGLNSSNYIVNNSVGSPDSVIFDDAGMDIIHLYFTNQFFNGVTNSLTISNIYDLCENYMNDTIAEFIFYNLEPYDVVINEIFVDPNPIIELPEFEFIELYNNSEKIINAINWTLNVGTKNKSIPDFEIFSGNYLILCSTSADSIFSIYGKTLAISGFPSLPNSGQTISIKDSTGTVISEIEYTDDWYNDDTKDDGGWSIEQIDPDNHCGGIYNWTASVDSTGGTPGKINSVDAENIDDISPLVEEILIISANQLTIVFSEYIKKESAENKLNYTIGNGIGYPLAVLLDEEEYNKVNLFFLNEFPDEIEISIIIKNITDLCDNVIIDYEGSFNYYHSKPYDIIINEIMADPEPAVELPEYEYIELFNRASFDINMNNWFLTVGTTTKQIPQTKLLSDSLLILCSSSAYEEMQKYGKTISVSGFPSLSNTGQTICIKDDNNQIISVVEYSNKWYKDEIKEDGGYSLELIDPDNFTGASSNWNASNDISGGTPGRYNSVLSSNPDVTPPELRNITVEGDSTIQLFFSESFDSSVVCKYEIYSVDNGIGNPINIDPVEPLYKSMVLKFNEAFEKNIIYYLTISDEFTDAAGNIISDDKNSGKFAVPEYADSLQIVINEILFDPKSNGVDFVELYNRTNLTFDIRNLFIATRGDTNQIKSKYSIVEEGFLFFPNEFIVISTNSNIVKQQYYTSNPDGFIELSSLPTFSNDAGVVIIIDDENNIIDEFIYDEDMHFELLNDFDGVSLERINYERPTNEKSNWHSAAENVGYATPAYENSQHGESLPSEKEIEVEPETFSPDNDGYNDVVNFHYSFAQPGFVANVTIYDSKGRLVTHLVKNELLGKQGTISWDGTNQNSAKARIGIYIIYFEIFDIEGKIKQYKKVCILAGKI